MAAAPRLRVDLSVDGGFGPVSLAPKRFALDTERLTPGDADRLRRLIAEARLGERHSSELSRMPDVIVYRLAVSGVPGAGPVTFDDVTMPPEVRPLVEFVRDRSSAG